MKNNKNELLVNYFSLKNKDELKRDRLSIHSEYPFSIPVIKNFKKLVLKKQITFIIGENGSGKSTLIEAFALCCGFNPEGGSRNFKFFTRETHSDFCDYLNIGKSIDFPVFDGYFLRSETLYNLATKVEHIEGNWEIKDDYGEISLHNQSHGESVLSLLTNRIFKRGFYIFDEPETGLSPKNLFAMLAIINDLVKIQSQFIICTHSPILLSFPDSDIYEIKKEALQLIPYEETDHYNLSKYFLMNYKAMLHKLGIDTGQ
jgi:predicted ATPase